VSDVPASVLRELRIGRTRAFGPNGEPSAIDKQAVATPLWLGPDGLVGDEQGDPRHHGGPEKAVHHYAAEHYAAWQTALPQESAACLQPGAFGENVSTLGLTETNVCVGDVFRLGGATVQVSQARQPCWKLNLRFGLPDMAARVQHSGRTGWYYRVLEAGAVAPGDAFTLIERPCPDWPLARMLHFLFVEPLDRAALQAIAALSALSPSWRDLAARRLESNQVESWSGRLSTPTPKT
jgi:MOSC domain-containing protein YiiM